MTYTKNTGFFATKGYDKKGGHFMVHQIIFRNCDFSGMQEKSFISKILTFVSGLIGFRMDNEGVLKMHSLVEKLQGINALSLSK